MEASWNKSPFSHISCLFPEILIMIFSHLDVRDKGRAAQVCVKWRDVAYTPTVWRGVEAKFHLWKHHSSLFDNLVRRKIRRVQLLSIGRPLRDLMAAVEHLESLNLTGCYNLTAAVLTQAFYKVMPNITTLNLTACRTVTDSCLARVARALKNLEVLELGGCMNVSNRGVYQISRGLKKLKRLNLRSCYLLTDTAIAHVAGVNHVGTRISDTCPAIEHLTLQGCQTLTDQSLMYVSQGLPNLRTLNFSNCNSISDTGIRFIARMPNLRELILQDCENISDAALMYLIQGGSQLVALDVGFCVKVGDHGIGHLSQGLLCLERLCLNACAITDRGITNLVRSIPNIVELNISQCNKITDEGLLAIVEHLHKLTSIDIYACNFTKVGLQKLMQHPTIKHLKLGIVHVRD